MTGTSVYKDDILSYIQPLLYVQQWFQWQGYKDKRKDLLKLHRIKMCLVLWYLFIGDIMSFWWHSRWYQKWVTLPILGFSSDILDFSSNERILRLEVFVSFLFSLILGTKTYWIFWRAPERGSFIRARFSFLSFKLRVVNINRVSFNCGFLESSRLAIPLDLWKF